MFVTRDVIRSMHETTLGNNCTSLRNESDKTRFCTTGNILRIGNGTRDRCNTPSMLQQADVNREKR